ncbi:hypothetical protein Tco_1475895 [Tanacetum coccineum]
MVTHFKVGTVKANLKYNLHVTTSSPILKSHFHALRDPNWKQAMCDDDKYGYIKNHKKTVKNGQTRIQERKSVQEPEAKHTRMLDFALDILRKKAQEHHTDCQAGNPCESQDLIQKGKITHPMDWEMDARIREEVSNAFGS